jgi:CO dehydrogenase/acetyl-CoA synthase alpha subunit
MNDEVGYASSNLSAAELAWNFDDIKPPLDHRQVLVESSRCHFCYDAPCIEACPTGIDIPGFIRKIGTGNLKGAAIDILEENIMGGICARVCPTEILCEDACVRNADERKPSGEPVGITEIEGDLWRLVYGPIILGTIDPDGKFARRVTGACPRYAPQPIPPG